MEGSTRVVHVEIHGQRYPIRSGLDPTYVAELATFVNGKMQLAAKECPQGDTLKVAVLAAINIADEYFRSREEVRDRDSGLAHRAEELERMLDLVLADVAPGAAHEEIEDLPRSTAAR
jgi:cell division protein ZapA